ncbi:MAG: ArnT family glycosyltransferase [Terriglobia bacterium]
MLWLVIFCLSVDVVTLSARMFADFRNYADVGYPDSAIILRIAEYVHTGHLYPDINQSPYYPTLYGPLGYVILSVPYRLAVHHSYSPDKALRLAGFGFFLGSIALVFLIARRLRAPVNIALLGALFAASGPQLRAWPMQIRPDMLALSFALLGIWLCLGSERRWQVAIAAVCGGLAFLCKQTFVAMPAAVFVWFLFDRRLLAALGWATGVAFTVITGYGFFVLREPLAWQHFAALSRPVLEYREGSLIVLTAMSEAKVLFSFFGAYFAWRHRHERVPLIILYALTALFIGLLTIPQAGGAINYFFEFWAISATLAAPGLVELNQRLRRTPAVITALVIVLLLYFFVPKLRSDVGAARATYRETRHYAQRRAQWERLRSVLAGRRLLAFEPSIALWSRVPELPDPYLNSLLEQSGTWSSAPIVRNLDGGVYEAIIYGDVDDYRGVTVPLSVYEAIKRNYLPACQFEGDAVWLPIRAAPDLYDRLVQAGCVPVSKVQ